MQQTQFYYSMDITNEYVLRTHGHVNCVGAKVETGCFLFKISNGCFLKTSLINCMCGLFRYNARA